MPLANTTVKDALAQLEALGNAKVRAQNAKSGAGDNQFGVSLGDPFAPIWINLMVSGQG